MHWIRKVLKCVSLTAAMFVFQACYGTMGDYYECAVTFHVVDDETGEPLEGVRVWVLPDENESENLGFIAENTDDNGFATVWTESYQERFKFIDKDSLYTPVDTVIDLNSGDTVGITLRKV